MGWPAPEYEVSIRHDDGAEAAVGELGNLWIRGVRGVSLFRDYLNDPPATSLLPTDRLAAAPTFAP